MTQTPAAGPDNAPHPPSVRDDQPVYCRSCRVHCDTCTHALNPTPGTDVAHLRALLNTALDRYADLLANASVSWRSGDEAKQTEVFMRVSSAVQQALIPHDAYGPGRPTVDLEEFA